MGNATSEHVRLGRGTAGEEGPSCSLMSLKAPKLRVFGKDQTTKCGLNGVFMGYVVGTEAELTLFVGWSMEHKSHALRWLL